jgi:hypothetical protein
MKKLTLAFIAVLSMTTIWFGQRNSILKTELVAVTDSLNHIKENNYFKKRYKSYLPPIIKESYLETNDSIKEVHRITANYADRFFLIRLELSKTNSVSLIFKRYSQKHLLTGQGEDKLLAVKTQKIDWKTLNEFRYKLSKIEFLDVTKSDNTFCCFGGGGIKLESILEDGKNIDFSTFCRASQQFAAACEFIMRQVDDKELKGIIAAQDKFSR